MAGRRTGKNGSRSKPKKGINRYDPNAPNWIAVHGSKQKWFPYPIIRGGKHGLIVR